MFCEFALSSWAPFSLAVICHPASKIGFPTRGKLYDKRRLYYRCRLYYIGRLYYSGRLYYYGRLHYSIQYRVEMGQVAKVFFCD